PANTGLLAQGRPRFVPSTPASCFYLLDSYARSIGADPAGFYTGRTLVVVGRSNSVGKPAQWLGLQRNATVIACHSKTRELAEFSRLADVLIVAAGGRGLVTGDLVREGGRAVAGGSHIGTDPEARLRLTSEEKERLRAQLGLILDHAAKIRDVATADVPPTASAIPAANVFRDDVLEPSLDHEAAMRNAPDRDGDRFKVVRIVETGS